MQSGYLRMVMDNENEWLLVVKKFLIDGES